MSKEDEDNDDFTIEIEMEDEEDIDEDIIEELRLKFVNAIQDVEKNHPTKDFRIEIINAALSIASSFAVDLDVNDEDFTEMASSSLSEEESIFREETKDFDKSKLN